MKTIKTFEAFDWQDFDNTDLAGMGWDMRAEQFVAEFCGVMEKEMPVGTAATMDRKAALRALQELLKNHLTEAIGHADQKFCGTEQNDDNK